MNVRLFYFIGLFSIGSIITHPDEMQTTPRSSTPSDQMIPESRETLTAEQKNKIEALMILYGSLLPREQIIALATQGNNQ